MKNLKAAQNGILGIAFLSLSLFFMQSFSNSKAADSKEIAEEINEVRLDDKKVEKDARFLKESAAMSLEEIKLGNLAQQKGTLAETRALGKLLVNEHTALLSDLKDLASKKSISIPSAVSKDGLDAYDDLQEETGLDFDKRYSGMICRGHKKAIRQFEHASSHAEDSDIRNFATNNLSSLRSHFDRSENLKKEVKEQRNKGIKRMTK